MIKEFLICISHKNRNLKLEHEFIANNLLGTESQVSVGAGNVVNSINERFILPRLISLRVIYSL